MKNKKGFTLIELLAVIVILAIIALIAVPIILNMINEARKSAAKSSALGYVDSIEAYTGFRQLSEDTEIDGYDVDLPSMTNGKVTCTKTSSGWNSECSAFFNAVDKKNKGKAPDTATVIISEEGKVLSGTKMKFNGYEVTYDGQEATVGGNSSQEETGNYKKYTPGELIQYDPVTNESCTSFNVNNIKNGTSTCYKWRVITTDDTTSKDKITLQMDHGIEHISYWGSYEGNNAKNVDGPTMALTMLEEKTSGWNNALKLNYSYDTSSSSRSYGVLSCTNGACTIKGNTITSNLKARIITGEEIANIVKTKSSDFSWSLSNDRLYYFSNTDYKIGTEQSGTGNTDLSWLVENSYNNTSSGATSNVYSLNEYDYSEGYFTLSPDSGSNWTAWAVDYTGSLIPVHIYHLPDYYCGLRPVIEVSKSALSS